MTYFCSLASGSRGNCAFYFSGGTRILIDAGMTTSYISQCLHSLGLSTHDLTHILITHSHTDHINALPVLLKRTTAEVVCTDETFHALPVLASRAASFRAGERFTLGNCSVESFSTPHDAIGSCGFVLGAGKERVAYCTDLGRVTDEIFAALETAPTVVLESNHDVSMLNCGPYPYHLKRRILSESGHLSNTDCADALSKLALRGTMQRAILAHLSETNNTPWHAIEESRHFLSLAGLQSSVALNAAQQREMLGPIFL